MSRRKLRYPEGSPMNYYHGGRFQIPRRGFNARRWSWRIHQVKTAAPALLFLLLLVACALLSTKGA
jgi:hypothetical protein